MKEFILAVLALLACWWAVREVIRAVRKHKSKKEKEKLKEDEAKRESPNEGSTDDSPKA